MLGNDWGVGEVLWSLVWFTLFFIWIWLLIMVFSDIFRSRDLSGWAKALWTIFVVILPYIGILVYFIARGHKMSEHAIEHAQRADAASRAYIQSVAGSTNSPSEVLARIADLKARGVIDDAEFQRMKAQVISS